MSLCGAADIDELSSLSAIGRRRAVAAGQVLTWAGDDNVVCANVVSGILKVTASTSDGREQIVGLVFGGDFVGQLFEETSSLTVTALVDSDLCVADELEIADHDLEHRHREA
ncbi:MAG: cyclic nucleotide-binding domain-containing protein, partial [Sphingomonas sp.]|nr:cyclic nucleotide-binding domain-containing protein [Sphingomonas sp.]